MHSEKSLRVEYEDRPGFCVIPFDRCRRMTPQLYNHIPTHCKDRMAERKNTHGLMLQTVQGVTIVDIGDMEIWDGADLSLIRDTLTNLVKKDRCRSIGIQMQCVKYIPSGFFGMLYDWFEQGISVRLYDPQPRVANMLWFRKFFVPQTEECYLLHTGEPLLEGEEWDQFPLSNEVHAEVYEDLTVEHAR